MQDDDDPLPASQGIGQDFRELYISSVIETIECANFTKRNRADEPNFTRKRKITFIHLIVLLTQTLSRSIQRELNSFFQKLKDNDFSIQEVTKSAFTQARAKLKPEAFLELNRVGLKSFYKNAPYLKWHGYRLLGVDGSTLILPRHESIDQAFGTVELNGLPRSIAKLSLLYDVLNFTTLSTAIGRYDSHEINLTYQHLSSVEPGKDILILDRGYASYKLMFTLQQMSLDYCIRVQESWWLEVRKMQTAGEKDKVVTFKLGKKDKDLPAQYGTDKDEVICRVVIIDLPGGGTEVLCTSVLDKQKIAYEDFASLYHFRWNIEEGFKLYKCRIGLEAFSGKTLQAVQQDIYAKVFMMTTAAVMAFPIEEKLKREAEQGSSKKKHRYKVNRTNALAMVKEVFSGLIFKKAIALALRAFDRMVEATAEIVRPGRKVPRRKQPKKPPSMNYKQL